MFFSLEGGAWQTQFFLNEARSFSISRCTSILVYAYRSEMLFQRNCWEVRWRPTLAQSHGWALSCVIYIVAIWCRLSNIIFIDRDRSLFIFSYLPSSIFSRYQGSNLRVASHSVFFIFDGWACPMFQTVARQIFWFFVCFFVFTDATETARRSRRAVIIIKILFEIFSSAQSFSLFSFFVSIFNYKMYCRFLELSEGAQ